jgi:hypothetical protein
MFIFGVLAHEVADLRASRAMLKVRSPSVLPLLDGAVGPLALLRKLIIALGRQASQQARTR